ncbi:hypothetical protein JD82_02499 [Prauserella rugosa]|uniref:Uncharacterized protein n=1 Tax=Prauserella rugosa TaxID=43354 RepID=A0A660CB18_9PSEU|nr:hypothetical protein JD82_02499 [Prauserella rugosa]
MTGQKPAAVGRAVDPVAAAMPAKQTVDVADWISSDSPRGSVEGSLRSANVPATRLSIASRGSAYASGVAPPPRSPDTTSATPPRPIASPSHCRGVVCCPSSGPDRAAATSGWSAAISADVPAGTPSSAANTTPER